jgi:1-acyl-sn-glycerol-3-phosphate acyltransferase
MSKGVLGNDPFQRGAGGGSPEKKAESPPAPKPVPMMAPQKPKPPPPPKPLASAAKVPVLTPQKPKAPPPPPKPAAAAPAKVVLPKPKPGGSAPARRAVTTLASEPEKKSPVVEHVPPPAVTAPERVRPLHVPPPAASPHAHPGSPYLAHNPTPHSGSPHVAHNPKAHEGSPYVAHDPKAHEGSPYVAHNPQAHEGSPVLRADATPHLGSPAVVAELTGEKAVPHENSPELVTHKVSAAAEALGLAREMSEGMARPFITAASGLYQAAKSALGLGSPGPVDTWGKDETLTRALHPVGDFLYDKYFRITVEGSELLPTGACIIVANHSGALPLDGPMLTFALQRERSDLAQARWLVEDQVFHAPVLGVLMNRLGAVRAHPENATRLLEEGRPVIVFPEGFLGISKPFTQRYQLKRFGRGGYVKLALKCKVPIVPVAITGAEESMPLLAKLPGGAFGLPYLPLTPPPLPARWKIRFSEPVDVTGGSEEDLPFVHAQNDRVRDTIAGMLESMVRS